MTNNITVFEATTKTVPVEFNQIADKDLSLVLIYLYFFDFTETSVKIVTFPKDIDGNASLKQEFE